MLAAAIQQRWSGELYALSRTGSDAQHVVVRIDKIFIDQDGPAFGKALIRRFERQKGFQVGSLRLVPFCATMGGDIPKPEKQEEIIAGICNHIPSTYTSDPKRAAL